MNGNHVGTRFWDFLLINSINRLIPCLILLMNGIVSPTMPILTANAINLPINAII